MRASNSWDKLTINQFVNINSINESDLDLLDKQIEITAILYNTTPKEIEKLSLPEYKEAVRIIEFMDKPMPTDAKQVFTIHNTKYRFMHEINKWTWGQWISVMDFLQGKTNKELTERMARVLALTCVPMKRTWYGKLKPCEFDGSKVADLEQLFYDNLTMDIANPISVFFYLLFKNSTHALQDYFLSEAKKQTQEAREILESEILKEHLAT